MNWDFSENSGDQAIIKEEYAMLLPELGARTLANAMMCGAFALAVFAGANRTQAAPPQPTAVDPVCETLLADYILRVVKIDSDTVEAAVTLVAARGRQNGYWQTVLVHFRASDPNDQLSGSPNLLAILTKMLAIDGNARWLRSRPEELKTSALGADVKLPAEVLDAVIVQAPQAPRVRFDRYVRAVVAAHDPRADEFLTSVLHGQANGAAANAPAFGVQEESKFHAACGLANLGHRAGVAWLVEAPLRDTPMLNERIRALQDLTGLEFTKFEQWQAWWRTEPLSEPFKPRARVNWQSR